MLNTRTALRPQGRRRRVRTQVRLPQPTERQVHAAVLDHLKLRGVPNLLVWHTPLGGRRDPIEAAGLKRLGAKKGVADLLLLHESRLFSLELKVASGGRVSEEQLAWASDVNRCGGYSAIARGLPEAIKILEQWGLLKPSTCRGRA
jgi:hypothetical protein